MTVGIVIALNRQLYRALVSGNNMTGQQNLLCDKMLCDSEQLTQIKIKNVLENC